MHWFRPVYTVMRLEFAREVAYKLKIASWVIADVLQPVIFAYLWSAVSRYSGDIDRSHTFFGYFFLMVIVTRIAQDSSIFTTTDSIVTGGFAHIVTRPMHYVYYFIGRSIGQKLLRILIFMPIAVLIAVMWRDRLSIALSAEKIALFLMAVLLAVLLNYIVSQLFSLLAFYTDSIRSIRTFFINIMALLTGELLPVALLLPASLFALWTLLPLRYLFSFPVELLITDLENSEILQGFGFAIFYLFIGLVLLKLFVKIGQNRYMREGK